MMMVVLKRRLFLHNNFVKVLLVKKFKHFIKSEDAAWITFIHGAGGSSTIWHKQVKVLKEHFNLLLIDLKGSWYVK